MPALDSVPRIASLGADDDRFQVHGALEIAGIMRRLISHRSLVSAQQRPCGFFACAAALDVDTGPYLDSRDAAQTDRSCAAQDFLTTRSRPHPFAAERAQASITKRIRLPRPMQRA